MRILPSGCVRFRKLFRSNTASGQSLYNLFLKLDFNFLTRGAFYLANSDSCDMHNLCDPRLRIKRHESYQLEGIEMGKPLLQKRLLVHGLAFLVLRYAQTMPQPLTSRSAGNGLLVLEQARVNCIPTIVSQGMARNEKRTAMICLKPISVCGFSWMRWLPEALSGTVGFEIGDTRWGMAEQGGALGADSKGYNQAEKRLY